MRSHPRSRHRLAALFSVAAATACGGGSSTDVSTAAAASTLATTAPTPGPAATPAAPTPSPTAVVGTPVAATSAWPGLPPLPAYVASGTLSYSVQVSRRDTDLYELSGGLGFIETQRCPEPALGESATLTMAGYRGLITFSRSGMECSVTGYFAKAAVNAGTYAATVRYRHADWYAFNDARLNDSYRARTLGCTESTDSHAAELTLGATQRGSFGLFGVVGGTTCQVEHLYVLTPLP